MISFDEFLASAEMVEDLAKIEGAAAQDFEGAGVVFRVPSGGELYAYQPCDKVPEFWTIICNEQPSGSLRDVAAALYAFAVSEEWVC